MKRQVALLLCGMLTISALAGCGDSQSGENSGGQTEGGSSQEDSQESSAEEEEESAAQADDSLDETGGQTVYEETIPFTFTSMFSINMMGSGVDYTQDSTYQYIIDKFNIEPELWACESGEAYEKIQTWINTGSMPDALLDAYFSIDSYKKYVDEGLIRALPDGWEERWPNIAYAVEVSGIKDLLEIDGKTYAIPHSAYGLYSNIAAAYLHTAMYYRKDLAKQVGMEDFGSDGVVTISELKEYLEKVQEAALTPIVLEGGDFWLRRLMGNIYGISENSIAEEEDGFIFIPELDGCREMLKTLQAWYQEGLLDAEYYDKSADDSMNSFTAGQSAAMPYGAAAVDFSYVRGLYEQGTGRDGVENLGYVVVTADDGSMWAATEGYNYWTATIFNPDTDEKTLERILDLTDWFLSMEGNTSFDCGVPGVDWEFDENDKIIMKDGAELKVRANSPFDMWGWCGDEFCMTGLGLANEQDIAAYNLAADACANAKRIFSPSANYESYTGDLKDNYSFPYGSKMTEIICTDVDVDSAWDAHLDEYRNLWEPLIEDLNKTYGYTG